MQPHERIFVAVDTNDLNQALKLVTLLKGKVGGFKFGLELLTSIIVRMVTENGVIGPLRTLFHEVGHDLFWDGKFADIPNTVGGAVAALAALSPKFLNIHASAGIPAMRDAVRHRNASKVLAVTLLTSIDRANCQRLFGAEPAEVVVNWALQAQEAAVDGLICSSLDLESINQHSELRNLPKMTPGIRPAYHIKPDEDQRRIMTPAQAVRAGSTWMVIGRPITEYPDGPVAAVDRICEEIAAESE